MVIVPVLRAVAPPPNSPADQSVGPERVSVPESTWTSPPSRIRWPPICESAVVISLPPESSSVSMMVTVWYAVSPMPVSVTVGSAPGRSMTTSSPAAGTCPVLQFVGSVHEPPASVFHETTDSIVRSSSRSGPPRKRRRRACRFVGRRAGRDDGFMAVVLRDRLQGR